MRSLTTVALCLLLAACEVIEPEWKEAPEVYTCTDDQMAKAEAEAEWCNENTDYFSTYCYGTSIMRNCEAPARVVGEL